MYSKIIHEIEHTFAAALERGDVSQSQMDHVTIILDVVEPRLPKLFYEVFSDLNGVHAHSSGEDNLVKVARLMQIIQTAKFTASLKNETEAANLHPVFTVSSSEEARILELCAAMRKIIMATDKFDQPHRLRLLNRIAAIESETQKPEGLYDVVLGGISELGETLGKFGVNIKPLTDRMSEVAAIARKGSKQYDQLPSPDEVKQLPAPDAEEHE